MPHQNWLQYSFQWCNSTKNWHCKPSLTSFHWQWNVTRQWKNSTITSNPNTEFHATSSSQSIISEVSSTINVTICALNSIWGDDKVKKYEDETGEKRMRCLWRNVSFSSWHATMMICHVLKIPKGRLGACTVIIPKERHKCYQSFLDQKMNRSRGKNKGQTSWWPLWPINRMMLQQCLLTLVRNKRDPHLLTCLCPLARVACRCLLRLE